MMNNVLIMSSPLIKINTNCNDEENNFQRRLQLTPVEGKIDIKIDLKLLYIYVIYLKIFFSSA